MHWANTSHEYLGIEDFMPLCQSHHYRYDNPKVTRADAAIASLDSDADVAEE